MKTHSTMGRSKPWAPSGRATDTVSVYSMELDLKSERGGNRREGSYIGSRNNSRLSRINNKNPDPNLASKLTSEIISAQDLFKTYQSMGLPTKSTTVESTNTGRTIQKRVRRLGKTEVKSRYMDITPKQRQKSDERSAKKVVRPIKKTRSTSRDSKPPKQISVDRKPERITRKPRVNIGVESGTRKVHVPKAPQSRVYNQKLRPARDKQERFAHVEKQKRLLSRPRREQPTKPVPNSRSRSRDARPKPWRLQYKEPASQDGGRQPPLVYKGRVVARNRSRSRSVDKQQPAQSIKSFEPSLPEAKEERGRSRVRNPPSRTLRHSRSRSWQLELKEAAKKRSQPRRSRSIESLSDTHSDIEEFTANLQERKMKMREMYLKITKRDDQGKPKLTTTNEINSQYVTHRQPNRYTRNPHTARKPDVQGKINTMENIHFGKNREAPKDIPVHQPLQLKVRSRVGSLENVNYVPRKSTVKVINKPVTWNRDAVSIVDKHWKSSRSKVLDEFQMFQHLFNKYNK